LRHHHRRIVTVTNTLILCHLPLYTVLPFVSSTRKTLSVSGGVSRTICHWEHLKRTCQQVVQLSAHLYRSVWAHERMSREKNAAPFILCVWQACWDARGGKISGRPKNSHSSLSWPAASSSSSSSRAGLKLKASLYVKHLQYYPEDQQMCSVCACMRVLERYNGSHSVSSLLPVDLRLWEGKKDG